jgi:hypothetical protein
MPGSLASGYGVVVVELRVDVDRRWAQVGCKGNPALARVDARSGPPAAAGGAYYAQASSLL